MLSTGPGTRQGAATGLYVALRRAEEAEQLITEEQERLKELERGFEMSVNGSAKENGMSSANLHPVTVKTFAEFTGISERQAKYFRKGWANPITRVMLAGEHVKPYEAARLVDEWEMGELALISLHVMDHGWALKDAELAILQVCSVERLQHPDIEVAELTRMINAKYVEPMRQRDAEGRVYRRDGADLPQAGQDGTCKFAPSG